MPTGSPFTSLSTLPFVCPPLRYFYACLPVINTSFHGGQWQGGFMPTGSSFGQSVNPAVCPPSPLTPASKNGNITPLRSIAWAALEGCYSTADKPPSFFLSGIFMSVSHVISTSFYGGQWQGGLVPAGSYYQSSNPAICPPPQSFRSDLKAV